METSIHPNNPLEQFFYWEKTFPQAVFLKQPVNDTWLTWTYGQAGDEIRRMASALEACNLSPKSNVAMLSKNCAHWVMADLAIWLAGHVSVPIYPTFSASAIRQILEHSESKILFVGKLDDFKSQVQGIPENIQAISFSLYGERHGSQWDDLVANNKPLEKIPVRAAEDVATIKYTSGTTGMPKGVMISFGALHSVTTSALRGFGVREGKERFFSYLPLSHIAERMLIEMGAIYCRGSISFAESLDKFPANLMQTKPTIFLAVPRIWAKFKEKIEEKMPSLEKLLRIPLVSTIVKKAIRRKLGLSKARWIFTGAAPISVSLLEWFRNLDIEIHEVLGMTENLAYSHINLHEVKFGSVGRAWPDVAVKITDEGELQMKHGGLMTGYFKEPVLTAQAFTADGFLRTGDKAEVDDDGFLTITGRIKDQFKTDKAKFVDPAPIELKILLNTDIEQVCVVGVGLPQPIALAVLTQAAKTKTKEVVDEGIRRTLEEINGVLESYERIKTAVILQSEWTIENGLMTPTLKVKRNEIEKTYSAKYVVWYRRDEHVVWE